jgi:branched-chain amino acid transport system ATP-binding protein
MTKEFGGLVAVKNVSFGIEQKEILGLIGPNGAGKTTLFNLITGLERPTSGDVLFEGESIRKLKPHSICRLGIARTYQNVRPFLNHTVRENIAVGVEYGRGFERAQRSKRIDEILDFLDLRSKESLLAKNLPIEKRKMVEVGRALGSNPKLLLLDEPMAGLNPTEITGFVELMKSILKQGVTILIVEHVMKAISSACSRVVVLHSGEVIATGSPEQVLSDKKVIDIYLGESYSKPSN